MPIFEVRYQVIAQRMLQQAISEARAAHAYVFHGPDGVGKRMLAIRFAKLLLCRQRQPAHDLPAEYAGIDLQWTDACEQCRSCTLVAASTHPDCHHIHRQLIKFHPNILVRNRKGFDLGVDVIRHFVIEAATKKPAIGPNKVFIINEADKLNVNAQNALLKTLEEPPPGTYIILLTRSLDTLLPTTQSRCQLIPFTLLPKDFVTTMLSDLCPQLTAESRKFFAYHEPGSIGRCLNLAQDGFYEGYMTIHNRLTTLRRHQALQLSQEIEQQAQALGKVVKQRLKPPPPSRAATPSAAADLTDETLSDYDADITDAEATRQAITELLAMLATFYRAIMCARTGVPVELGARGGMATPARLDAAGARSAISAIATTEYRLNCNSNTKLCLDELGIRLARLHGD